MFSPLKTIDSKIGTKTGMYIFNSFKSDKRNTQFKKVQFFKRLKKKLRVFIKKRIGAFYFFLSRRMVVYQKSAYERFYCIIGFFPSSLFRISVICGSFISRMKVFKLFSQFMKNMRKEPVTQ